MRSAECMPLLVSPRRLSFAPAWTRRIKGRDCAVADADSTSRLAPSSARGASAMAAGESDARKTRAGAPALPLRGHCGAVSWPPPSLVVAQPRQACTRRTAMRMHSLVLALAAPSPALSPRRMCTPTTRGASSNPSSARLRCSCAACGALGRMSQLSRCPFHSCGVIFSCSAPLWLDRIPSGGSMPVLVARRQHSAFAAPRVLAGEAVHLLSPWKRER